MSDTKVRAALGSIFASAGLAAAKLLGAFITGSLSLLSDALHALLDVALAFGEHRRGRYSAERPGFGALPAALSSSMICLRHSMPYWMKAVRPSSPMP